MKDMMKVLQEHSRQATNFYVTIVPADLVDTGSAAAEYVSDHECPHTT
jgi:hypothetical protein